MGEERNGNNVIEGNDAKKPRKKAALAIFAFVTAVTIAVGFGYWWYRQSHVSTDDAYVEGRIHPVGARIQGSVVEVLVRDNEPVKKGQPLLRIDAQPYSVRVAAASEALASARADLTAARSDVVAARSDITAARSRLAQAKVAVEAARAKVSLSAARLAQANRDAARAKSLFERHSISRERNEKAMTEEEVAKAQEEVTREELKQAEADLPTLEAAVSQKEAVLLQREAKIGQREADVKQKGSNLSEARLFAGYTEVTAPSDGYVTRKSVEAGQVVSPGQWLLAVAPLSDVWVVANYKETDIEKIRPGQEVEIRVDTYPGRKFRGKVDSIMAGTGSAFSLFPPENATGNYVKVVQRVPVKILIEKGEDPDRLLRIGMSVVPTVLVR